jgi:hypothetical protein
LVKPETFRDSLTTFPEPVVTEQATSIVTVAIRTMEARQRPLMGGSSRSVGYRS